AAGAVVAFVTVADILFIPLHRQRVAQGILGCFNGLSRTLQIPTLFVVQAGLPWRFGHRQVTLTNWLLHSTITFLFYFLLFLVLGGVNRLANRLPGLRRPPPREVAESAPPADAPATLSRRRFIRATKSAVVAGGALVALG